MDLVRTKNGPLFEPYVGVLLYRYLQTAVGVIDRTLPRISEGHYG
jgi:hypothetical protein